MSTEESKVFTPLDDISFQGLKDQIAFIDFWAPWCGPCLMMNPILDEKIAPRFPMMKYYKVNTDEQPNLAMKFSITSIPTMHIIKFDEQGNFEILQTFMGTQKPFEMVQAITQTLTEAGIEVPDIDPSAPTAS